MIVNINNYKRVDYFLYERRKKKKVLSNLRQIATAETVF